MRAVFLIASACAISCALAGEEITKSPRGRYTIVQRYIEPKDPQDKQDYGAWEMVLRFSDASKPEAILADEQDHCLWPGGYVISADERWILRLQKTGSGENSAMLYRVEPNGQVWRMEQHLDDLAFVLATAGSHLSRSDYYHVGVGLVSWDLASGLLHLKIVATAEDRANPAIDRKVVYDLHKHKMIAE